MDKQQTVKNFIVIILPGLLMMFVMFFMMMDEIKNNKVIIETLQVNSFADCARAGGPIMESYPRQCRYDGKTFTEKISR